MKDSLTDAQNVIFGSSRSRGKLSEEAQKIAGTRWGSKVGRTFCDREEGQRERRYLGSQTGEALQDEETKLSISLGYFRGPRYDAMRCSIGKSSSAAHEYV